MATSDIMKQAVFDQRIVQLPARYAVDKGALSVTNSPYNAISASTSQHTYNINVPSQNVFVDRAVDWSSDVYIQALCTVGSAEVFASQPVALIGRDVALSAFPLTELVATMTATINDTSVIINTDTVLHEVLRLCDYKKNRLVRHCPTMLDRYKSYTDATGAVNNPISGYFNATDSAEVPNGAWYNFAFTLPNGQPLPASSAIAYSFAYGGATWNVATDANGLPLRTKTGGNEPADANGNLVYQLYFRFYSTEKLVLSPFIFADAHEWETGLFGINNIQLVMNLKSDISRVLRYGTGSGRYFSAVGYNQSATSAFVNSKVNVQYLTPSLDLPLPSKSVVPYLEFPRYITTASAPGAVGQFQIASQTIVLPQIPDSLLVYVKPLAYAGPTLGAGANTIQYASGAVGDWYYPIEKITVNFDNFAGLLSSHTTEQLYQMSVHNGLEMDFNEWRGKAINGQTGLPVQTVGGFLVLKPGQDFGLQSGQAPSLIGNFTLQFTVTCQNWFSANSGIVPQLYVIAVNSGFFETLAGSSRIIKGVLSEADIISAEPVLEMSRDGLRRMVGTGFFGTLGSMLSKAVDIYTKTKPVVSAIKGALPEGKIKDIMGKIGYGHGGAVAGAGVAGAGMAGAGKKSLSARLM